MVTSLYDIHARKYTAAKTKITRRMYVAFVICADRSAWVDTGPEFYTLWPVLLAAPTNARTLVRVSLCKELDLFCWGVDAGW